MMRKSLYYDLTVANVCMSIAPALNDFKLHTPHSFPASVFPCLPYLGGGCPPVFGCLFKDRIQHMRSGADFPERLGSR
jgi:hypothetical protein